MISDVDLKVAVYRHVATTTVMPTVHQMAERFHTTAAEIRDGYQRLFKSRVLVLEADGETIRMAPPFSGVPTQHQVKVSDKTYMANCAWDSLGIIAALHEDGTVHSRCEQTMAPLTIPVGPDGPPDIPCIIHFAVPAAQWWRDIVYT